MAEEAIRLLPGIRELLADKAYDTNSIRAFLKEQGIRPVIPGKSNRKKKIRHDKLYPAHARTRKSFGSMTRKLSVTESQNSDQRLGTFSRRN